MENVLKRLELADFDTVYQIMENSFPMDERRDYEAQKKLLSDPYFRIYGIKAESGEVKAFITVYEFDEFTFAEHFAVAPEYRNCGLGSEILGLLCDAVRSPVCLEVELPETDMAKRRIGFYNRNGFFYNEYDYIQPAYSKEKNPVPLKIMTTNGHISEDEFEIIRRKLYKNVYNAT